MSEPITPVATSPLASVSAGIDFFLGPLWASRARLSPAPPERIRSLRDLPSDALVVVLGCPVRSRSGESNRYFGARVAAAVAAYHARPTSSAASDAPAPSILCSGWDREGEATRMVELLIEAGVPASEIALDGQAFRTLDTIDRLAHEQSGRPLVFISQDFHLPRVLFLARARGLRGWALPAEGELRGTQPRVREMLARFRAVFDVRFKPPLE